MTFILIFLVLIVISFYLIKEAKQNDINAFQKDIQQQYELLNEIVLAAYNVKVCPNCKETEMIFMDLTPTGQSVKYKCDHCGRKIISPLLIGKTGTDAINQMQLIHYMFKTFSTRTTRHISNYFFNKSFSVDADVTDALVVTPIKKRTRRGIPERVRNEVWRRDEGRCVECGSNERLEFDHIIPWSKGGADTARNLQLLCQSCNRNKSAQI